MGCHICGQEAVDRCFTCGQLFCEKHGEVNCQRCETSIAPGDRRADHVSKSRFREKEESPWWRPQQADDFEPPACFVCKRLARQTCTNCRQLYCPQHAGPSGLCRDCGRSSLLSMVILGVIIGFICLLLIWKPFM